MLFNFEQFLWAHLLVFHLPEVCVGAEERSRGRAHGGHLSGRVPEMVLAEGLSGCLHLTHPSPKRCSVRSISFELHGVNNSAWTSAAKTLKPS